MLVGEKFAYSNFYTINNTQKKLNYASYTVGGLLP